MDLLLVRHGVAEERDAFVRTGRPDAERPLTSKGRRQMRRGARGLARLVPPPAWIATSPYRRAVDTAEILAEVWQAEGPAPIHLEPLVPDGRYETLLREVQARETEGIGVLVGHEPHLSGFAAWLLTGAERDCLRFTKGGAMLLQLDSRGRAGHGRLQWFLTAKHLRALR